MFKGTFRFALVGREVEEKEIMLNIRIQWNIKNSKYPKFAYRKVVNPFFKLGSLRQLD